MSISESSASTLPLGTLSPAKPVVQPVSRRTRIARWISELLSPPIVAVAIALLCAWSLPAPDAWLWAGLYVLLAVLLPTLYIVSGVLCGRISDFHLRVRSERIRPLLFSIISAVVAWALLWRGQAPELLQAVAGINSIQAILFLAITLRWKISLHTATVAGLAVFSVFLFGWLALVAAAMIPLVAWARVRLRRHTVAQTIAGALLGLALVSLWLAVG